MMRDRPKKKKTPQSPLLIKLVVIAGPLRFPVNTTKIVFFFFGVGEALLSTLTPVLHVKDPGTVTGWCG